MRNYEEKLHNYTENTVNYTENTVNYTENTVNYTENTVNYSENDPRDCAYNSNLSPRSRQNRLIFTSDYGSIGLERE